MRVQLARAIPRDSDAVWEAISDLGSHHEWMRDALSVDFATVQRSGVGTIVEVLTRVGPLRTLDRIEVTGWVEGESITIAHTGAVRGHGTIALTAHEDGTLVTLTEDLVFPWWLGGRVGSWVAEPILRRIWSANLGRLEASISSP